jgi:hypothetical protein
MHAALQDRFVMGYKIISPTIYPGEVECFPTNKK